jgi:hypothetical protein
MHKDLTFAFIKKAKFAKSRVSNQSKSYSEGKENKIQLTSDFYKTKRLYLARTSQLKRASTKQNMPLRSLLFILI